MDWRYLTVTTHNAVARYADGSVLWSLERPSPSGQRHMQEQLEDYYDDYYGGGGDEVFIPASDAAVAGLEKQAFQATAAEGCGITTGCTICLESFKDGEEVTVMPCSSGHEFHPGCITKWLGKSNTCPLCCHALPTHGR